MNPFLGVVLFGFPFSFGGGGGYASRNVVEIRLARELKRRAIERYDIAESDIKSVDEWTDMVHLYNGREVHCP